MNTIDLHDVFGSIEVYEYICGSMTVSMVKALLSQSWDDMYGRDPEVVKPDDSVFEAWARQALDELAEYNARMAVE